MHAREGASAFDRLLRMAVQPRFRKAAAVCFAAVVLLTVVSYAYRRPVMESSITRSVTTALRIDGHAGVTVDVKGRDVSLRGSVADAAERRSVIRLAQKRNGVRVVDASALRVLDGSSDQGDAPTTIVDGGTAADATTNGSRPVTASTVAVLPLRKPRIEATFRDGVLSVSGNAPTKEAADALLHRSSTVLQPDQLVDKIVVPTKVTELADMNEYRRVGDFLALLLRTGLTKATLRYDRGKLKIAGVVPDESNRAFLEREAQNLVGLAQLDAAFTAAASTAIPTSTSTPASISPSTAADPSVVGAATANPSVPATGLTAGIRTAQSGIDSAIASRTIGFAKNSDSLSDEGRAVVDDVAAAIVKFTDQTLVIQIAGYTDDRGSEGGNLELSQRRADAVRAELVAKGVVAGRISARGFGEADPVALNDTDDNRAKNRRIQITVVST